MKIRPVRAELFHADRTDEHEAKGCFRNFQNRVKITVQTVEGGKFIDYIQMHFFFICWNFNVVIHRVMW